MRALPDAGARWRDTRKGVPGISTLVERLGAFLILIGLSGLTVGGIGVVAAVRAWLEEKRPVIATLKALRSGTRVILLTYLMQIGTLAAVGVILGLALGAGLLLLAGPLIAARLPVPAVFGLYPRPLAEAALYGMLIALIFTLWPLARAAGTPAAILFRADVAGGRRLPRWRALGATALAFVAAATAFSGNARLALWTLGGLAATLAALGAAALLAAPLPAC